MELSKILNRHRVTVDVSLTSKKSVLDTLAKMLSSAEPTLSSKTVFDCLLARERLGTTGLGGGTAIPHGRIASNGKSIGAFVRTVEPIDFDAVDNVPVDIFFALCVPEEATNEHLVLLSELAANFSNSEFVNKLRHSSSSIEIYELLIGERLVNQPAERYRS